MGLHVHSLAEIPLQVRRAYFIYLLDYGWYEPLGNALLENFDKMATIASKSDAVVIRPTVDGVHFHDEVFSWHGINGYREKDLLPAILVTDKHPQEFKESYDYRISRAKQDFRIVLFPLKQFCSSTTDVIRYIDLIFEDIVNRRDLMNFSVAKEMNKSFGKAIVDGIILEPNVGGIGYNFKSLIEFFSNKNK